MLGTQGQVFSIALHIIGLAMEVNSPHMESWVLLHQPEHGRM